MPVRTIYCTKCGIPFSTLATILDTRKRLYEPVFCPCGHEQHEGEDELGRTKQRAQNAEERAERNWKETLRMGKQISVLRGVITRMKKARTKQAQP